MDQMHWNSLGNGIIKKGVEFYYCNEMTEMMKNTMENNVFKIQRIWGHGFAQFTTEPTTKIYGKWLLSLTLLQLTKCFCHPPHALKPGMNILIWRSGGIEVQICKAVSANTIELF